MSWILFENALLHGSKGKKFPPYSSNMDENDVLENDNRCLQLSDVRIPLIFVSYLPILFIFFLSHFES